ncbi:MAG: sigma-54 dependent transcriptional regulator [Deltaproteobacteria bacterium]|nr:sigma-54 dependent transcriptional regulator [Deltaproteobacteria bacterium]
MNKYISGLPILLVDDEEDILHAYKQALRKAFSHEIITFTKGRKLLHFLENNEAAVVVLDLFMPSISGLTLLKEIAVKFPLLPVIVMTGTGEVDTAVECMKEGAFDYLTKPADRNRLVSSIKKAIEMEELRSQVSSLKEYLLSDNLEHEEAFKSIITRSKKIRSIFQYIEATAPSPQPILITGETGTGKELFAGAIHEVSSLRGAFVAVNVAGLDDNMFSDTLFGHAKGAYSGAEQSRNGLVEKAAEGTLFLDEIGDLSESSQVKLLRLLQESSYYPLGSDNQKISNARVVVSTNRDLSKMVSQGLFRKDLYYRLNSHKIYIPPLRERTGDTPLLVKHFIKKSSFILKKKKPTPPNELFDLLSAYHFPGNVRELEGMVFDAVTRHKTGILSTRSFRDSIKLETEKNQVIHSTVNDHTRVRLEVSGRLLTLKEAEELLISKAMEKANNNQRLASEMLGITRQALNKRLIRKKQVSN